VPIFISGVTLFAKKLASRERLNRHHFYFGIDQTIAALSIPIVNGIDMLNPKHEVSAITASTWKALLVNGGALLGAIFLLFVVLSLHQDYESKSGTLLQPGEIFWVGVVSNVVGFGLLFACATMLPRI
jgi:hypothetical protein